MGKSITRTEKNCLFAIMRKNLTEMSDAEIWEDIEEVSKEPKRFHDTRKMYLALDDMKDANEDALEFLGDITEKLNAFDKKMKDSDDEFLRQAREIGEKNDTMIGNQETNDARQEFICLRDNFGYSESDLIDVMLLHQHVGDRLQMNLPEYLRCLQDKSKFKIALKYRKLLDEDATWKNFNALRESAAVALLPSKDEGRDKILRSSAVSNTIKEDAAGVGGIDTRNKLKMDRKSSFGWFGLRRLFKRS